MVNLNIAVSVTPRRMGNRSKLLYFKREEKRMISPMALGSGGKPRFPQARSNQTSGSRVNMYFSPRFILRVRVWLRS